jgi:hypothetical protein
MLVGFIFTIPGMIGFGYALKNGESVYLVCFLYGMTGFGLLIAAVAGSSYAMDAFRDSATEIFIMAMVFKDFFFYGASSFINTWMASAGPTTVLNILAGISVGLVIHI